MKKVGKVLLIIALILVLLLALAYMVLCKVFWAMGRSAS